MRLHTGTRFKLELYVINTHTHPICSLRFSNILGKVPINAIIVFVYELCGLVKSHAFLNEDRTMRV